LHHIDCLRLPFDRRTPQPHAYRSRKITAESLSRLSADFQRQRSMAHNSPLIAVNALLQKLPSARR